MDFVYRFCAWVLCMESRHTVCRCCRCDWALLATCLCGAGNQRQGAASSGNRWLDDGEGSHTGSRWEARQNKRHHSKQHQHGQIDTTRNWIPAGYILAKCALLNGNCKQDLGANQQTQRKTSSPQADHGTGGKAKTPDDQTGRHHNGHEHERHFNEFRRPFTKARHKQCHTNRTQHKAHTEHQYEVSDSSLNGSKGETIHQSISGSAAVRIKSGPPAVAVAVKTAAWDLGRT